MKDPRTAASVASCLDDEGFINTGPTHQLAHPALSRVFAGGDICTKERFGGGERMAGFAHAHAFLICENIERLTGTKSGPLQAAHIGVPIENKGVDGAAKTANEMVLISLGKTDTLLYSKLAMAVPFFQTPDAMEEKYGKIDEAPNGWVERGDLSAFKFAGWHDMFFGALGEGRDEWWAQFDAPRLYDAP